MALPTDHSQLHLLRQKKRPVARLLLTVLLLACLLVAAFTGWNIAESRRTQLAQAETATSNLARLLTSHGEAVLRVASVVLEDIVEQVEVDGIEGAGRERLRQHLERAADKTSELNDLFVFDEHGAPVATSLHRMVDNNNADREYFRYHQAHRDTVVHIGTPIRSRTSRIWIIPISRRIERADGRFAGVALATLRLDFFEDLCKDLEVGKT
jgi:hypothetical protein